MLQRNLIVFCLVFSGFIFSQDSKFDIRMSALAERPYTEEGLDFVIGAELGGRYAINDKFSSGAYFNYSTFSAVFNKHRSFGVGLDVHYLLFNNDIIKPYLNLGANYFSVNAQERLQGWDSQQEQVVIIIIDETSHGMKAFGRLGTLFPLAMEDKLLVDANIGWNYYLHQRFFRDFPTINLNLGLKYRF